MYWNIVPIAARIAILLNAVDNCQICLNNVLHIEMGIRRAQGGSIKNNQIYEPFQKHSAGGCNLRDRKRCHLVQKTPVAHSHRLRVPVTRQWDVVAAATTAEHFATVSTMVPTPHDRESRLACHASRRIIVRHPSRRSLDALLPPLGHGRSCESEKHERGNN